MQIIFSLISVLGVVVVQEEDGAELRKRLLEPDEKNRSAAVSAMGLLAKLYEADIDALCGALVNDSSKLVRSAVAQALGHLGPPEGIATDSLIEALRSDDVPSVRAAASRALARSVRGGDRILSVLEKAANDDVEDVRRVVIESLVAMGPEAIGSLGRLLDGDHPEKAYLVESLAKLGLSALPLIKEAEKSGDPSLKLSSIRAIGLIRVDLPEEEEERLFEYLGSSDREIREEALKALSRRQCRRGEVIDEIRTIAGDSSQPTSTRIAALEALESASMDAARTFETVEKLATKSDDPELIIAALRAWDAMEVEWEGWVELATSLLDRKKWSDEIRVRAASMLQGKYSTKAVPALIEATRSKDPDLRREACRALISSGDSDVSDAKKALLARLRDDDASVRAAAARALWIDRDAKDTVKALVRALRDESPDVRLEAMWNLFSSERLEPRLLAQLRRCLDDDVPFIRIRAAEQFLEMELEEERARQALFEGLESRRDLALRFLPLAGELPPVIVERLSQLATRGEDTDRLAVLGCLYSCGADRDPGMDERFLLRMLRHTDVDRRIEALSVIGAIGETWTEGKGHVIAATEDLSHEVRIHAFGILETLHGEGLVEAALEGADDPKPVVRQAALEALASLAPNDAAARDRILIGLKDSSPTVRLAAVAIAPDLSSSFSEIDELLIDMSETDPHEMVRRSALYSKWRRGRKSE